MYHQFLTRVSVASLSTALLLMTSAAMGQEAVSGPASATPGELQSGGIDDIIVTAQRRSERLQDVPISIAAFSSDQLSAKGATKSSDIGQLTTGLIVAEQDSSVVPYIRGVGSDTIILGEVGSVATYLDGVYMPDATGGVYDLANIESIEVLKGPQGTLFGRNTAGGAVNIRTQAPKFKTSGKFEASYGNFDAIAVRGYITGPISDKIAVSVAGNYSHQRSYINDLVRGGKVGDAERYSIRGSLLFKPTDRLDITLAGDYTHNDDPAAVAVSAVSGYLGQTPTSIAPSGPYDYIGSIKPKQIVVQEGVSLRGVYDFGGVSLTSLTAYRFNKVVSAIEVDRTPYVYADLVDHSPAKVFSQEVQLASNGDGPFTWLIGGYYSHQNTKYDPVTIITAGVPNTDIDITTWTDIYALFANGTYKIGDLELTGGLRYNKEKKEYTGAVNGFTLIPKGVAKHTWNSVTPRIVLSYHPSRDFLLYASYTAGFKSGAYNTTSFPTEPIDPETVDAYEVGLKLAPSRAITINSALFWYERKDVQVQSQDPSNNLQNLENAAKARSKGAEVEITARPLPGLSLTAGVTYLDAKYSAFPDALVYIPTPVPAGAIPGSLGNTPTSVDVSGQRVERAPKWTVNLAGSYRIELGNGGSIVPSANLFYTTEYFFNRGNRLRQPGYTLINADLAWNLPNGLTFSVWGKNLTNKVYYRTYVTNAFADSAIGAEPRTYGVRLGYKF